jgi:hypothetical protein
MRRLEDIENDLAETQNALEDAAMDWYLVKRNRVKTHAEAFIKAEGTVGDRTAHADLATADMGWEAEGRYEGLKAKARVLGDRAAIGMAILKSQGRAM